MIQPRAASHDGAAPRASAAPFGATLDWRDIPVFVVNRNRLGALRRLVDWLCAAGTRRVVIMDNASDYPPLLQYYEQLPEGVKVMRLAENHGPYVLWEQGVHAVLETPYVVTDSDVVPADFCPPDLIAVLLDRLLCWPDAKKVGMALRIDNLPDCYGEADTVRKWESQFWEHPVAPGVFAAPIDTTFALYPPRGEFSNEACNLRLGHPYIAEHTPWYADETALSVEERYYRDHTSATFSNWSVARKESWVQKSPRVVAFAQRPSVLHVDGGREYIFGWINAGVGTGRFDLTFDPRRCREQALPLADDSLDGIHLSHVLEAVGDAQALFDELHRVARPGARLHVRVAHGARLDAWHDPHQERAWYEGSFAHFAQPALIAGACTAYRGDWQVESLRVVVAEGTPITLEHVRDRRGAMEELIVTLVAVKPARPRAGQHPATQSKPRLVADDRADPDFRCAASRKQP
jgi:SAM-dependent methyltransferase